jgi:oligopeptide transport system ATP-binding protein
MQDSRTPQDQPILQVKGLRTEFHTSEGIVKAVDGVDFDLRRGEVLAIVGESGSGKSVTNLSIMNLIASPPGKITAGEVLLDGVDVLKMSAGEIRAIRGKKVAMIFQDPMTSLNPFLRISTQMTETIILHEGLSKKAARAKAIEMLRKAGIPSPEKRIDQYPHQFSGGMRQRVMIAIGLSCDPEILIADEPTSALDVTIQAQILELMKKLTTDLGTALILITHSLGVVAGMCDRVSVMYAGRIVEHGTVDEIFDNPKHPYTVGLIRAVPRLDRPHSDRLYSIPGQPPNVVNLPECCPFFPRCEKAMDICKTKYPPKKTFSEPGSDPHRSHSASCWLYSEAQS